MTSLVLALALSAWAGDPSAQARELADLRAEVESLSSTLTMEQEDLTTRLRALGVQQADLGALVRREELRLRQAEEAAEARRLVVLQESAAGDTLRPALAEAFRAVGAAIDDGVPYRLDERRRALRDLQEQVDQGLLGPEAAASRLWAMVEDERRLARENAIDRQVILLDGQEMLVEVARIGAVAVLFQTGDGRVGWAERGPEGWGWTVAGTETQRRQVQQVFTDLSRQVRTGWFDLPGASLSHLQATR